MSNLHASLVDTYSYYRTGNWILRNKVHVQYVQTTTTIIIWVMQMQLRLLFHILPDMALGPAGISWTARLLG